MLGLNPLSSAPISDLGALTPITGYINTTDTNDTATINAFELDTGIIYTTDSNDTATINGVVVNTTITGSINTTDGNDTASLVGSVLSLDTHDGFTKKEIQRAKELDRRRREAEQKLVEARRADAEARRKRFQDLIDPKPVAKKQQNKVQLPQEIQVDIPSAEIERLEGVIANLDRQERDLQQAIAHRKVLAETVAAIAILDAKMKAERDDEEALLLLL